jgi:hypothetical protein
MRTKQTELDKLVTALLEFYSRETYLLEKDLGERTLTHRLAAHIEKQFPGSQVDCNFDRLGERTLHLPRGSIVSTDDRLGKSIYPDIVVHQRDVPNNLLAIEVRKAGNHQPIGHDRQKLQAMTDPNIWFAYWIGMLLTLASRSVASSEVYVGGLVDR